MKKLLYFRILIISISLYSCTDNKDLFDEPAAERVASALAEYNAILRGAKNGWIMEYYAGEEPQKIGGYVYLCSFGNDGKATVASELDIDAHKAGTKVTSLYKLIFNQGIVLTFDAYNDLFHYFSTPSADEPNGMKGDYEFVIKEASPQKIIMEGKKRKNRITMTPVPESVTWSDYLEKVIDMAESNFHPIYKLFIRGVESEIAATLAYDTRMFTFTGSASISSQNIIYTPVGFKFYSPVTVDGSTFQNFTWNTKSKIFECTDNGVDIVFAGNYPPNYLLYDEIPGVYSFQYKSRYGEQVLKTVTVSELVKNKSYKVSGAGNFDFVFGYDHTIGGVVVKSQHLQSNYYMYMWTGGVDINIGTKVYYQGVPNREGASVKLVFSGYGSPTPIGFLVIEKGEAYYIYDISHCYSYLEMTRQ